MHGRLSAQRSKWHSFGKPRGRVAHSTSSSFHLAAQPPSSLAEVPKPRGAMVRVVQRVETEEDLKRAHSVRFSVFVHEQGIAPENEIDELESKCIHFLVLADGTTGAPIGTARLQPDYDSTNALGKLGRFAVLQAHRGTGVGRELANAAEQFAREEAKLKGLVLHAQLSAAPFYSKLGYATVGASFLEENIPHVKMQKLF